MMHLDPLQSTFLGSQLLMSAFSLVLFTVYRLKFLLYFAFIALVPLANLLLRDEAINTFWFAEWVTLEGLSWCTMALGHGIGLLYGMLLMRVFVDYTPLDATVRWLASVCIAGSTFPIFFSGTYIELALSIVFCGVYVVAFIQWFAFLRINRRIGIYMGIGVILVAIAFFIDYLNDFHLHSISAELSGVYSFSLLGSFFFFFVANFTGINHFVQSREIERLNVEQQQKMATLGEIASSIAHEIKNPLAAISYANELQKNLLKKDSLDKEQILKLTDNIAKTSGQIKSIVDSLHALARDSAQDPFEIIEVRSIIDRTFTLFSLRLRKSDVFLQLPRVRDQLDVECREIQICQVLLNLLNNAFDAVQDLPTKWVRLDVVEQSDKVLLRVVDSGHGIPESERKKIFTSFYSTKPKGHGTGLGLNISKRIIDAHEGRFVMTEYEGNTSFEVYLPRRIT